MSVLRRLGFAALVVACCPWSVGQAGVFVGVGVPGPYYRPYYRPYYGYGYGGWYRPYGGIYVAPPPLIVGAAPAVVQQPVVVQQQPVVVQPAYAPPAQTPAPLPMPAPTVAASTPTPDVMPAMATNRPGEFDAALQQVQTGDEPARADALIRLGRLQDPRGRPDGEGPQQRRQPESARGRRSRTGPDRLALGAERLAICRPGRRQPRSAPQRQLRHRGHPRQLASVKRVKPRIGFAPLFPEMAMW